MIVNPSLKGEERKGGKEKANTNQEVSEASACVEMSYMGIVHKDTHIYCMCWYVLGCIYVLSLNMHMEDKIKNSFDLALNEKQACFL